MHDHERVRPPVGSTYRPNTRSHRARRNGYEEPSLWPRVLFMQERCVNLGRKSWCCVNLERQVQGCVNVERKFQTCVPDLRIFVGHFAFQIYASALGRDAQIWNAGLLRSRFTHLRRQLCVPDLRIRTGERCANLERKFETCVPDLPSSRATLRSGFTHPKMRKSGTQGLRCVNLERKVSDA